jgi:hypothetical protein
LGGRQLRFHFLFSVQKYIEHKFKNKAGVPFVLCSETSTCSSGKCTIISVVDPGIFKGVGPGGWRLGFQHKVWFLVGGRGFPVLFLVFKGRFHP